MVKEDDEEEEAIVVEEEEDDDDDASFMGCLRRVDLEDPRGDGDGDGDGEAEDGEAAEAREEGSAFLSAAAVLRTLAGDDERRRGDTDDDGTVLVVADDEGKDRLEEVRLLISSLNIETKHRGMRSSQSIDACSEPPVNESCALSSDCVIG